MRTSELWGFARRGWIAGCCLAGLASAATSCRSPTELIAVEGKAADSRAESAPVEAQPLTLASWNIEWLHAKNDTGPRPRSEPDYERLRHYAELLDADVVALQEVEGQAAAARVFNPTEYAFHFSNAGGSQRSGFAYRKQLRVVIHQDLEALSLNGTLRGGADISVGSASVSLRLLGVHLKSGCFDNPLASAFDSCQKLQRQNVALETWIDERVQAGAAFAVLGDFNRRLNETDPFFETLNDNDPKGAELSLVTAGQQSRCWGGRFPEFIDHVLLSREAHAWWQPGSFRQLEFELADADGLADDFTLSDHCPIRVVLLPGDSLASPAPLTIPRFQPIGAAAASISTQQPKPLRIKGNISSRGKFYHLPHCPNYAATRINERRGERWFVSEIAAQEAGWSRANQCPANPTGSVQLARPRD